MNRDCELCKYEDLEMREYPCSQCSMTFGEEWEPKEEEDTNE